MMGCRTTRLRAPNAPTRARAAMYGAIVLEPMAMTANHPPAMASPSGPNAKSARGSPTFPELAKSVARRNPPCAGPRHPTKRATTTVSSQTAASCSTTCNTSRESRSRGSVARASESNTMAGMSTSTASPVIGARSRERARPTK
jgi:hypothetical protein